MQIDNADELPYYVREGERPVWVRFTPLEVGVSQEELDRSHLSTQQMNAALREGYSMEEVLEMFDCRPAEELSNQGMSVQQLLQSDARR